MIQLTSRNIFTCFFLLLSLACTSPAFSQPCTGAINSFPYNEGFETTDGNWLAGGTASDWDWGTPAKAVINAAGGGNRSWMVGGLTGSSYNNGENSFLMSPCFNFSTLVYPQISFKVFWETERRFDGASFQYSIDGGTSWTTLGSDNSNSNCDGENWFNANGITYLGNTVGWSGNVQSNSGSCLGGSGSGAWLTAKHTLRMLSGQVNVRFRFTFGAGTTCNAYDGFAVDDILIQEAPANTASITSSCIDHREVSFTAVSTCAISYAWNFDDLGSGVRNTSTLANPSHRFPSAGTYLVTLVTTFASGPPVTSTKEVVMLGLSSTFNWPGRCTGAADATLGIVGSGSSTPYFYSWNTTPPQNTPTITNVGPGNYTVIVSSLNACNTQGAFELDNPTPIIINTTITAASCAANNGSISSNVTGGTAPYLYSWSNGAGNAASIQNLAAGNYSLEVRDTRGCSTNVANIIVPRQIAGLPVNLGPDATLCTGESLVINAGFVGSYIWQDGSTNASYTITTGGQYYVSVTDVAGCTGSDTINVKVDCSDIYFPNAFTPNGDTRNDFFGPLGNLAGITAYTMAVYNRYGQRIFTSNDPFKKWDGRQQGEKPNTGSFVWVADYIFKGKKQHQKGNVTLIR